MIGLLLIGFVLYSAAALYIYQYGQADHAAPADIIVILGAGVYPDGTPTEAHIQRTKHAAALYKQGLAPYLLCTGGFQTPRHVKSEAQACSEILVSVGVPQSAILMEEISQSTEENAIQAHKVMLTHNLKTAIVTSDNYHLLRSEILFHAQGIPITLSPAQATEGPLRAGEAIYGSYREVAALVWYDVKIALHLPYTETPF